MGLREVLEYLVVLQLSGRSNAVEALYSYFVDGEGFGSVSELARLYGLSKAQLRSYVYRIFEKVGSVDRVRRARLFVRYLAPAVLSVVKPVVELRDGVAICVLCGATLPRDNLAIHEHVASEHRDVVEHYLNHIISILRERCRASPR